MGKVIEGYLNPDDSHEGDWVSSEQPRTITATREQMIETWLRLYAGNGIDVEGDVGGLFDSLAIEAEATAAVPLDALTEALWPVMADLDSTPGPPHVSGSYWRDRAAAILARLSGSADKEDTG